MVLVEYAKSEPSCHSSCCHPRGGAQFQRMHGRQNKNPRYKNGLNFFYVLISKTLATEIASSIRPGMLRAPRGIHDGRPREREHHPPRPQDHEIRRRLHLRHCHPFPKAQSRAKPQALFPCDRSAIRSDRANACAAGQTIPQLDRMNQRPQAATRSAVKNPPTTLPILKWAIHPKTHRVFLDRRSQMMSLTDSSTLEPIPRRVP